MKTHLCNTCDGRASVYLTHIGTRGPAGPEGEPGLNGKDGLPGKDGTNGIAATITVGKTESGEVAKVTNVGTASEAIFDFVIPGANVTSITPDEVQNIINNAPEVK